MYYLQVEKSQKPKSIGPSYLAVGIGIVVAITTLACTVCSLSFLLWTP